MPKRRSRRSLAAIKAFMKRKGLTTRTYARGLKGTKSHHAARAGQMMSEARNRFRSAKIALGRGQCTTAYMNILEGWEALGKSDAHGREAGQTAYKPVSDIQEIGHDFTTKCLRDEPAQLDGRRKRRWR